MKTLAAHGLAGGIVQNRMGGSFGAGFLADLPRNPILATTSKAVSASGSPLEYLECQNIILLLGMSIVLLGRLELELIWGIVFSMEFLIGQLLVCNVTNIRHEQEVIIFRMVIQYLFFHYFWCNNILYFWGK
jgi:hypothetical protein